MFNSGKPERRILYESTSTPDEIVLDLTPAEVRFYHESQARLRAFIASKMPRETPIKEVDENERMEREAWRKWAERFL